MHLLCGFRNPIKTIQKKFLKFINTFKLVGIYPQRNLEYSELLSRFKCNSLEFRGSYTSALFIKNVISGVTQTPVLLQKGESSRSGD